MTQYGCRACVEELDMSEEAAFKPSSVREHFEHLESVHGKEFHESWKADSALELLGEIMGLPSGAALAPADTKGEGL